MPDPGIFDISVDNAWVGVYSPKERETYKRVAILATVLGAAPQTLAA